MKGPNSPPSPLSWKERGEQNQLVRGVVKGQGVSEKCRGSNPLKKIHFFILGGRA